MQPISPSLSLISRQIDECKDSNQLDNLFQRLRNNASEFHEVLTSNTKLVDKVYAILTTEQADRIQNICNEVLDLMDEDESITQLTTIIQICSNRKFSVITDTNLALALKVAIEGNEDLLERCLKYVKVNEDAIKVLFQYFPPNKPENLKIYPLITRVENDILYIKTVTVKSLYQPYQVLAELLAYFDQYPNLKTLRIEFVDSRGVDASGLLRQFISQLFQGLCEVNHTNLAMEKQADGRYLPSIKEKKDDDNGQLHFMVGKLLALAANSAGNLPLGEIFPERFFLAMTKIPEASFNSETMDPSLLMRLYLLLQDQATQQKLVNIRTICNVPLETKFLDEHKVILREFGINDQEIATLDVRDKISSKHFYSQFVAMMNVEADQKLSIDHQAYLDNLAIEHEGVATDAVLDQIVLEFCERLQMITIPLINIAMGVRHSLPIEFDDNMIYNWEMLQQVPASRLEFMIQGRLTKEFFMERVETSYPELRHWLKEWVDGHSIEEMRNVVRAITGSTSLSNNLKFNLCEAHGMYAHTCFNSVDVPNNMTKAMFMDQLNEWGAGKGITGFNRA